MSSTSGNEVEVATLVVKVASRCNMNCDYCYIYNAKDSSWRNMPAVMSRELVDALAARLVELVSEQQSIPALVLHGGEPFLAGIESIQYIADCIGARLPGFSFSIQSNGTIYSDRIERFLIDRKDQVRYSISVDGYKDENDRHRVGLQGQSLYPRIERTIGRAVRAGVLENILMVVDIRNSPAVILDFMRSTGVENFNLLLPDGDYETLPGGKTAVQSDETGRWLWEFFTLYAASPGRLRVRLFDEISSGLLRLNSGARKPARTYSLCTLVVETNGEIKQSDTFRVNGEAADSIGVFNVLSHSLVQVANSGANRHVVGNLDALSGECLGCKYLDVCGGGYPNHRYGQGNYSNPSVYCSDYRLLFARMERALCM